MDIGKHAGDLADLSEELKERHSHLEELRQKMAQFDEQDAAKRDRYQRRWECLALAVRLYAGSSPVVPEVVTGCAGDFERWLLAEEAG